jgi:hypothetical protein
MINLASECDQSLREEQLLRRPTAQTSTPSMRNARFATPLVNTPRPSPSPTLGPTPMDIDAAYTRPRGPLTLAERQRRKDNNLCFYCGSAVHSFNDCPNRRSRPGALNAVLPTPTIDQQENADTL